MTEKASSANNPAGRLHDILTAAMSLKKAEPARAGWAKIFNINPDDTASFAMRVAAMAEMMRDTRMLVSSFEDEDPDVILEHFGEVEHTVSVFFSMGNNKMEWVLGALKPTGMHSLKLCASLLRRRRPEPVLTENVVEDLLTQCRSLMDDVRGADDLNEETRIFILEHLLKIARRLEDIRYNGTGHVDATVSETLGVLKRRQGIVRRIAQSHVGRHFVVYLATADLALQAAALGLNLSIAPGPAPEPSPIVVEIGEIVREESGTPLELPAAPSEDVESSNDLGEGTATGS